MRKQLGWILVLALLLCLALGSGCAEEGLEAAARAVREAETLDRQLALLTDMADRYGPELDIGGWDLGLTCAPAEALPADLCPAEETLERREAWTAQDFRGEKLICVYRDGETLRLLGDFQARLPRDMRADSLEDATAVLYLVHDLRARSDYIGSAYNQLYTTYVFRRGETQAAVPAVVSTSPPLAGWGVLTGETVSLLQIWPKELRWFYETVQIQTPEGVLEYLLTERTARLVGLRGTFDRLEIPAEVEGRRVTAIDDVGITEEMVRELILPEGLAELGESSVYFGGGEGFRLPSSLKILGRSALMNGAGCALLVIPDGVTVLNENFLKFTGDIQCVYVPAGVTALHKDLTFGNQKIRMYTPAGSAAAGWAEKHGMAWTACESAEALGDVRYATENGLRYCVIDGEAIVRNYTGADEYVRIPESLGGAPVTQIQTNAFLGNNAVRAIVLPESLQSMEEHAISECSGLKAVFIPGGLTGLKNRILSCGHAVCYAPVDSEAYAELKALKKTRADWAPGLEEPSRVSPAWNQDQAEALHTVGAVLTFGSMQEKKKSEPTPVQWQVLAVEEGRSLLISNTSLGNKAFDDVGGKKYVTWETSTLRQYLNDELPDLVFSPEERALLIPQKGDGTLDLFSLLSKEEAETLLDSNEARTVPEARFGVSWWLRSPERSKHFWYVGAKGDFGVDPIGYKHSLRPVIWVRTAEIPESAQVWIYREPEKRKKALFPSLRVGDTVTLGRIEQDRQKEGEEAIEWIVVERSGDTATLLTKTAISLKSYGEYNTTATWDQSGLARHLSFFPGYTFTEEELAGIVPVTVKAEGNPEYPEAPAGNDVEKCLVTIPGIQEITRWFPSAADRTCDLNPTQAGTSYWKENRINVRYWLRNPGQSGSYAAYVDRDGSVSFEGESQGSKMGVRNVVVVWCED